MLPEPNSISSSPIVQSPEVNAQHPWLGLLPYKEEHRDFFFGRDREIEDILGRIRDNNLTILYGQSGLGKSSLLAAGVVPRLSEADFLPAIIRLSYDESTERPTLVWQTRIPLIEASPEAVSRERGASTLWQFFHHRSTPPTPIPVLIFDQFEEIFTLGAQPQFENEVAEWVEQIADLLQNRPPRRVVEIFAQNRTLAEQYYFGDAPVRIVFTLREDYLASLERWKVQLPLLMQNRMALTLLTGPQARQAVLGPAQLGDHSLVNREVAESIVRTVARVPSDTPLDQIKAVPPLLSLLCEQLNAARIDASGLQITAESVRDQADDILRRFYEDSFLTFPPEHCARIRALLEDPPMITEAGYRNALVRADAEAQLTRAGIADAKSIFDTLIQRRLITAETRDQVQRLEITHDVLVQLLVRSRKERQDREAKERAEREAAAAQREQERLDRERNKLSNLIEEACRKAWGTARDAFDNGDPRRGFAHLAEALRYNNQLSGDWLKQPLRTLNGDRVEEGGFLMVSGIQALHAYAVEKILFSNPYPIPLVESMCHEGSVYCASFSPDGCLLVTGSEDQTARLWKVATGELLVQPMCHDDRVWSANFSADGRRIVTTSADKTARLWDAATGMPLGELMLHGGAVTNASFSPDGARLVTASTDKTTRFWDAFTGKPFGSPKSHENEVWGVSFSPDGTRFVTASRDRTARIWEVLTGRPLLRPMKHDSAVLCAKFSPNGQRVVTAAWDGTVRLWDAATGRSLGMTMRHDDAVTNASFSPDGMRVVTASSDHTVRLWDASTGKPLGEPLFHDTMVWGASFSPNGRQIATTGWDGVARLWAVATCRPIVQRMRHEAEVTEATISPDGQRIVTACMDKTARLWDAASGKPIGARMKHRAAVFCARFSPGGQRIVTYDGDRNARLWNGITGEAMGEATLNDRRDTGRRSSNSEFSMTMSGTSVEIADLAPDNLLADPSDLIPFAGRFINDDGQARNQPNGKRSIWKRRLLAERVPSRWQRILHWKLSEPNARTITIYSKTTAPEHIEREVTWAASHLSSFKMKRTDKMCLGRSMLTDLLHLDPAAPLVHLGLAAIEENRVNREFLINYGLERLAAADAKAAHQKYSGTYRAKAAIILWLMNEKPRARQLLTGLLSDHDPKHETWANPEWINRLWDFEWPEVFREALLEMANNPLEE